MDDTKNIDKFPLLTYLIFFLCIVNLIITVCMLSFIFELKDELAIFKSKTATDWSNLNAAINNQNSDFSPKNHFIKNFFANLF